MNSPLLELLLLVLLVPEHLLILLEQLLLLLLSNTKIQVFELEDDEIFSHKQSKSEPKLLELEPKPLLEDVSNSTTKPSLLELLLLELLLL